MHAGILSTIGNTPLVKLERIFEDAQFHLFAKLEGFNPAGSIKDRTAFHIIGKAMEEGRLKPGMTVIESSSGNMGIGLAQACGYFGVNFICVVDSKTTKQNIEVLSVYGAEIDLVTEPDPFTGEFLQARLSRVKELLQVIPNSFWPDQYSNINNVMAHYQTMQEIVTELGEQVDYLFCAASTCGTLRGCVEYLREQCLSTKVVAVDAIGSVIFGGQKGKRLIPGHGAAVRPYLFRPGLADECVHVSDLECVIGCRRLITQESILAGGSSGAALMAVERLKHKIPDRATCVVIFPDRGDRYLDTIYSEAWVEEHFGDVSHFWQNTLEAQAC